MRVVHESRQRSLHGSVTRVLALMLALALVPFALPLPASAVSPTAATIAVPPGADLAAAVAAARAGDTIVLSAGEYAVTTQILVNKPLTIIGAGRDATVIRRTANAPTMSGIHGGYVAAVLYVPPSGALQISHLTINGGAAEAIRAGSAIYAVGPIDADDIRLTQVRQQRYIGFGLIAVTSGHEITNSVVDHIERVGIHSNAGSQNTSPTLDPSIEYSLRISGCTFTGDGDGDRVQYGVETERGGRTLIEDCTLSNYTGIAASDGSGSAAFLATSWSGPGKSKYTVNDSIITNCSVGMNVGYSAQTTDTIASFSRNTFSQVPWDVYIDGPASVMSVPSGDHNVDLDGPGADGFEYFEWWEWTGTDWAQVTFDAALIADFWNRAPVVGADSYSTGQGEALVVAAPGVLSNDTDANTIDTPFGAAVAAGPGHGAVELAGNGAFLYVPEPSFVGTDTFTYTVTDGYQVSEPGTVTIEVVNVAPVAVADEYETDANTTLMVVAPGVLGNDVAGDGDPLAAALGSAPANGTVFLAADGSFGYVPDHDFSGIDAFTYTVTDGLLVSAPATVTITVNAPVVPPVRGIVRVAGANRYATNVAASVTAFPGGAGTVVIATGANWPDALGGSALAGVTDGPLLLTAHGALPAGVKAEIVRLDPTKAYILGGTAAVGAGVEAELLALLGAGNVERLGGANRYETAERVADEVIAVLGDGYDGTAFVATGANFPDALASSPIAAAKGWPILLANPVSGAVYTPSATTDAIVLGGPGAVSASVEAALAADLGAANVIRLGGANRYATAARIAKHGAGIGLAWDGVGVATGENFPDALSAGAMLGELETVILLTPTATLHSEAAAALAANKGAINRVHIVGGTAAVTAGVEAMIRTAAGL